MKNKRPMLYADPASKVGDVMVTSRVIALFDGEAVIKVPDDGQKRVAFTREELIEAIAKHRGIVKPFLDEHFGEEKDESKLFP